MSARPKPFLRSSSLGSMFKKKQAPGYQTWVDEDALLEEEHTPAQPLLSPDLYSTLEEGNHADTGEDVTWDLRQGFTLVECFYLGAHDMAGRSIRGRGCIDTPAGELWLQTQEESGKKRRRRTLPPFKGDSDGFRPRYVKLVAVQDELEMRDAYSNEKITSFLYSQISFVGTHPKFNRLFAFVAHEKGSKVPSCYGFKCEDELSACTTAVQLDGVFHQRCCELKSENQSSPTSSIVAVQ